MSKYLAELQYSADLIVRYLGVFPTIVYQQVGDELVELLIQRGVNVKSSTLTNDPYNVFGNRLESKDVFQTVVLCCSIDWILNHDTNSIAGQLYRCATNNALLIVFDHERVVANGYRAAIEDSLFAAGFRKHANYFGFLEYGYDQPNVALIPLERIDERSGSMFDFADLIRERHLHMDMLRETGSRSNAHLLRYSLAANFIRPGDSVVDAGCGFGYGSYIIARSSPISNLLGFDSSSFAINYADEHYSRHNSTRFTAGVLPHCLEELADSSVDFIVCMETLEHVVEPEALLTQFYRILTPGGRIAVSVPHDWSDASGQDPNPFHHQVYTLQSLVSQISQHFDIELMLSQVADRVKDLKGSPGSFVPRPPSITEIDLDCGDDDLEAEWLLCVASKSPIAEKKENFVLRAFSQEEAIASGNTLNLSGYQNPWLFRSIVWRGMRTSNPKLRAKWAREILSTAEQHSADEGAALCVLAYIALEGRETLPEEIDKRIRNYIANSKSPDIAVLRWRVSLSFAYANVLLQRGENHLAERYLFSISSLNPEKFSVTLITKEAEAVRLLAVLAAGRGQLEEAHDVLRNGFERVYNKLISNLTARTEGAPAPFYFHEVGEVFSLLATMLGARRRLEECLFRPSTFYAEFQTDSVRSTNEFNRVLRDMSRDRAFFQEEMNKLLAWRQEMEGWASKLAEGMAWHQKQSELLRQEARSWEEAKEYFENELQKSLDFHKLKDELISTLRAENAELKAAKLDGPS